LADFCATWATVYTNQAKIWHGLLLHVNLGSLAILPVLQRLGMLVVANVQ